MADFPTSIFVPRETENLPGVSYDASKKTVQFAEDYSLPAAEIAAIESALGTNPQGAYATVRAWLDELEARTAAAWGSITGTLASQLDLKAALDAKQDALGFTAENSANKSTSVTTDAASNTKYPSVKAVYDWAVATFQAAGSYITASSTDTLTNKNLTSGTNTFPTLNQNTTGSAAKLTTARNIDGQSFDGSADITVVAPATHAATSKSTPVDADEMALVDSAASNVLKKLTWANLKATLKTYFDTVYQAAGSYITASSTDTLTNKTLTLPRISSLTPDGVQTITFQNATYTVIGVDTTDTLKHKTIDTGGVYSNVLKVNGNTLAASSGTATVTLPNSTDTLVGRATTDTLTNKRITARVSSITSSATPTLNTDNYDVLSITALAAAITSMTTNLSGTPTDFQPLKIRIKDDGTARAITWGASFASRGCILPTTTFAGKTLTLGFLWNAVTSTWDCVASAQEV